MILGIVEYSLFSFLTRTMAGWARRILRGIHLREHHGAKLGYAYSNGPAASR